MIGFGIDLAGYTTGNTSLAAIEIEGQTAQATLLRGSPLSMKRQSSDLLREVLNQEAAVVRRCLAIGPVAVDVPIDLQGLPSPDRAEFVWQLTRRPIDRAVKAMPAFADRIGAPVARFAAVMREGNFGALLGERLFEAYPAGTLKMLKIAAGRYKGADGLRALSSLCTTLKIEPHVKNDHDIDAIICAITAIAPEDHLCWAKDYGVDRLPLGFRLLKKNPVEKICAYEANFSEWIDRH